MSACRTPSRMPPWCLPPFASTFVLDLVCVTLPFARCRLPLCALGCPGFPADSPMLWHRPARSALVAHLDSCCLRFLLPCTTTVCLCSCLRPFNSHLVGPRVARRGLNLTALATFRNKVCLSHACSRQPRTLRQALRLHCMIRQAQFVGFCASRPLCCEAPIPGPRALLPRSLMPHSSSNCPATPVSRPSRDMPFWSICCRYLVQSRRIRERLGR